MLGNSQVDEMTSDTRKRSWWFKQLPNSITLARIALVPLVLWLVLSYWSSPTGRIAALLIFILAAATDGIDGGLARRFKIESNFGKLVDPIADKFLLSGSLIALSWLNVVPWLATALILGRELAITLLRLFIAKKRVIPANAGGKLKTVIQIVAVSMVILPLEILIPVWALLAQTFIWVATAVTLATGVLYLVPSRKAS